MENWSSHGSAFIYVSGYVPFKMAHKYKCQQCVNMFVSESPVDNDYFQSIDRGGLKVPSAICSKLGHMHFVTYYATSISQQNMNHFL